MPTGSIKKNAPSWREFNILEKVDLDVSIGHLFAIDIFLPKKRIEKHKSNLQ